MTGSLLELSALLHAPERAVREAAWDELIARQTRLLMAIARSFHGDRDAVMERYAFMLEKLRDRNFHRLRAFEPQGRASFSTWLTVAARRLCLDYERARYGRDRDAESSSATVLVRALRKRLVDSEAEVLDVDRLPSDAGGTSEDAAIRQQTDTRLREAVTALDGRDQLLLALRFHDDLSAARIAKVLNFPSPFHVYRRLNAVLATLRASLVAYGIEDSRG